MNTAKIVDKVDEGMEEKMLKLKGAAQDLFGSKERWVALVPKPGQLAPPGVACATAVVFKSTVMLRAFRSWVATTKNTCSATKTMTCWRTRIRLAM